MTFCWFPEGAVRPVEIAGGASEDAELPALFGPFVDGLSTMVVCVVVWGQDGRSPTGPPPRVALVADGAATEIPSRDGVDPTPVRPGGPWASVHRAGRAGRGTFRLEVSRFASTPPVARWGLRLVNDQAQDVRVGCVVADSRADSRQPWIDLAPHLDVTARSGFDVVATVPVQNHGTGVLRLTTPPGGEPIPGVTLVDLPARVPPNGAGEITLRGTGLSPPRPSGGSVRLSSNDSTVPPAEPSTEPRTHRDQIDLTLTSFEPSVAPADVLVVDPDAYDGGGVVRIGPGNAQSAVIAGAGATGVVDVLADPTGAVLLLAGDALLRLDPNRETMGVIAAESTGGWRAMARDLDGTVVVLARSGGDPPVLVRVDPATGAQTTLGPVGAAGSVGEAGHVSVLPDRTILVGFPPAAGSTGHLVWVDPGGRPIADRAAGSLHTHRVVIYQTTQPAGIAPGEPPDVTGRWTWIVGGGAAGGPGGTFPILVAQERATLGFRIHLAFWGPFDLQELVAGPDGAYLVATGRAGGVPGVVRIGPDLEANPTSPFQHLHVSTLATGGDLRRPGRLCVVPPVVAEPSGGTP